MIFFVISVKRNKFKDSYLMQRDIILKQTKATAIKSVLIDNFPPPT